MTDELNQAQVYVDANGSLVINAPFWKALGLARDTLIAHLKEGTLVLEKQSTIKQRLKARFSTLSKGKSLATELMAERRMEANRENDIW
ncbi:AbrB family transcriptional regulator [Leptolyngbya sp. NK1-12]|uniref:AbrB family transcriptional regulator n=1 Tax=Leptolyngbya sp. NK1-12 TaxID=2547451 RepID=A0AA96WLM8_9CYAN|nr:hypothetical protein [Leptolyngbya sp. NK1-12]WNZ27793.1 AbrB family transcriptional regulator [Leptolyngbya sp. NK1-12]